MNRTVLIAGLVIAVVGSGAMIWTGSPAGVSPDSGMGEESSEASASPDPYHNDVGPAGTALTAEDGFASLVNQLAMELKDNFGERIFDKRVQAALLEVLHRLQSEYPEQGLDLFRQAIEQAFPELAAGIMDIVLNMEQYENWLEENYLALSEMKLLQRQGTLWQKRRELFGADADILWSDEREAWAQKKEAMQQVIRELSQNRQSTLDETLYQLQTSLDETYGNTVEQMAIGNGVVAQVYFGFDSVQENLRRLSPEARQEEINRLRSKMGYSEEQIERLANRDQQRELRWQNGYAYMAERDALASRLSGDALERELAALREKYFQHEANTIALEEKDGFFRYERPRLYGRN